jgi:hypothetical protein
VVQIRRRDDQGVDVGVVQHPRELARLIEGAHGNHHGADARRGHEGHRELGTVGQQHADVAALANTGRHQRARRGQRPPFELGEGQAVVPAHQKVPSP